VCPASDRDRYFAVTIRRSAAQQASDSPIRSLFDGTGQKLHEEGPLLREAVAPGIGVPSQGKASRRAEQNPGDRRIGGHVERLHADLIPHGAHRLIGIGKTLRHQLRTRRITTEIKQNFDADTESDVAAVVPEQIGQRLDPLQRGTPHNGGVTDIRFQFGEVGLDHRKQQVLTRAEVMLNGAPCRASSAGNFV
jgi:hypothetical protein